ncbi:HAD-IA family hydrolase [Pseudonocardia acidicola]|uniref:HAD-IA family hydrolase n=1 Tax=Pseudonocardia acidicola TaxID=2724939 RepID=A0ABX1SHV1_9PSEU|nr:HAD-IA family hydrolase [Pseudonocardia acidicola]NMI00054.1 HAD-IA family hydrolase [Pseudonocardia acidicola]
MAAAVTPVPDSGRAPDRRPRVVLLDVFDTMVRLDALRTRFVDVGRPEHECDLFIARTLRDGIAMAVAGPPQPFVPQVLETLRSTTGHKLSEEALNHVLDGFRSLPPYPDAELALITLAKAKIPAYAFTYGGARGAADALDRAGLRTYLRGTLSSDELGAFKPAGDAYRLACAEVHAEPDRVAMVTAHSWDVHGAMRAGLVGGLATRLEGGVPRTIDRPHVQAERVDQVVDLLLELPA